MSTAKSSVEIIGKLHIDRAFKPDVSKIRITPAIVNLMSEFGMATIGEPVFGVPPRYYALWYGTKPTPYNEVPVVLVGSKSRTPGLDSFWACGVAAAHREYVRPSIEVIEEYSTNATASVRAPEHAIVRSVFLLAGKRAIPTTLHNYIAP